MGGYPPFFLNFLNAMDDFKTNDPRYTDPRTRRWFLETPSKEWAGQKFHKYLETILDTQISSKVFNNFYTTILCEITNQTPPFHNLDGKDVSIANIILKARTKNKRTPLSSSQSVSPLP